MAKHEFGFMQTHPMNDEKFNTYEPEKYNCIAIHDDFIEPILTDLLSVDCYWHSLQTAEKGLAYCGITLIPPESLEVFIKILSFQNKDEYHTLLSLSKRAQANHQYIIHFGI